MATGQVSLPNDGTITQNQGLEPWEQAQAGAPPPLTPPAPLAPRAPQAAPGATPQSSATMTPEEEQLQRESWGSRAYHGIMNALGGQFDTQYIPTPNGVVQQQVAQTPGQQWKRIISGALLGLGGAAEAGTTGPGGTMRGLGAGINAGYQGRIAEDKNKQQQANTQFSQDQEAAMNNARRSLMAAQVAKDSWDLSYAQKTAYEADTAHETNLVNMVNDAKDQGGRDLGVFKTFEEAMDKFNADPTLHDKHAQGELMTTAHVNGKGQIDGVHVAWVPKAWQDQKASQDVTFQLPIEWDDKGKPTKYQPVTMGPSTNSTNGQVQDFSLAMANKLGESHKNEVENQTKLQTAANQAKLVPAEAARDWAEAENQRAEASDRLFASGAAPGSQEVVDAIGTGHVTVQRLGQLLSKPEGQRLLANVMAKYPDFDQSKVAGYIHAVQDYTDTKLGTAGGNLRTVGGAIQQLKKLSDLNTGWFGGSSIHGTEANTRYKDMVHNVAPEIAKFLGTSTKEGIEQIESELLSVTPGNRRAAIQTQARALGDVVDQYDSRWREAAPSARYEAPMPGLSQDVKETRALLDPEYAQRYHQEQAGGAPPPAAPSGGAGAGQSVSLSTLRGQPEFKGMTDDQIRTAAEARHYTVTQ